MGVLTYPWRRIHATWQYWGGQQLIRGSLRNLAARTRSMLTFDGTDFKYERADGRLLNRVWPSNRTMLNPLWWVTCVSSFVWRWFRSRPVVWMLPAVPAVIFALGLLGAASSGSNQSTSTRSEMHKRLLISSLEKKDIAQARLSSDALLSLHPDDFHLLYDRALLEFQAGELEVARQIMSDLALEFKSERAALWLARNLGEHTQFATWDRATQSEYYRWLSIASRNAPADPLPRRLLADVLRYVGKKRQAYELLLPIAETSRELSYTVLLLERELGLADEAKVRAEKLIRVYRDFLSGQPQDALARAQLAEILVQQAQASAAMELLDEGAALTTKPEELHVLRRTKTRALVTEAARLKRADPSPRGFINSLAKLRDAMAVDPTCPELVEAITRECLAAAESKNNEMLILREALVRGVDTQTAHFILGTIALKQGKVQEAMHHLEITATNNPNLPGVLNNLAHAISQTEEPDLAHALRLSSAAVSMMPEHPYMRETRGQILLKLKRYGDAIADLELALAAPELRPVVRESLAQAYEASGRAEIAQRQRELLQQGK